MADIQFTKQGHPILYVRDAVAYRQVPALMLTTGGSPVVHVVMLGNLGDPELIFTEEGYPITVIADATAGTTQPEPSQTPSGRPIQYVRTYREGDEAEPALTVGGNPIVAVVFVNDQGSPTVPVPP